MTKALSSKELNEFKKVKLALDKEIKKRTAHIFPQKVDKTSARYNELHPSSYPFCGLQQAYEEAKKIEQKPLDYFGEYYTSVGTLIHELIQRYMGYQGKVIGFWKCRKCKSLQENKKPTTCPSNCFKCKHDVFDYEEIGIEYKKYTRGHLDGIIKILGKYYIIDYKSSSEKNNSKHRQFRNVYPYKKNVSQIKSYIFYVERQYGIKIAGYFLIYLTRDANVKDFILEGALVSDQEKVTLAKKLKSYEKQFSTVMKLRKENKQKYWDSLIKSKPCKTMVHYKEEMHSYDMCPLAEGGVCFNSARLKREISNLTAKIKIVEEL